MWLIRRRKKSRPIDAKPGVAMNMESLFEFFRVDHWGEFWWVMVGWLGQALFSMRFLIQWICPSGRADR